MHELESKIATLRERARTSRKKADGATEDQVRAFEDQYRLFKAEMEKKELAAKGAYTELSESAKKAWDELWTGVDKAYKNIH